MKRTLRVLLLLASVMTALPAPAAEVGDLFEAVVPVASQSAADRARAVAEGFRQVLVKASGQRSVLALPAVQAEAARADALLGSYRYEAAPPRQPGQVIDPVLAMLRLRMSFDPAGVRAVLNRAGAPVWGASRPPVYLRVARADTGLAVLGTAQADTLLDAAAQRGLPVVLPSPGDSGDAPPAGVRVALAATVTTAAGKAQASGALWVDGSSESLAAAGSDEFAALRELMSAAADRLGGRFAVVARADQLRSLRLRVSGVAGLEAYAGLEHWLAGLPLVRQVALAGLTGDRATFDLTLAGEPARLAQAMRNDGRFASIGEPAGEGASLVMEAGLATP